MNNSSLHIISFDIPYPADYGGVVDVYYKLRALSEAGIKIILHCYEYGREHSNELKSICKEINYYSRNVSKGKLFSTLPYIVSSRSNEKLLNRLLGDNHPILMEGLHSTYFINDNRLKNRFKIVRTHNIEHEYYKHLARKEHNVFKQSYYRTASFKLSRYESVLAKAELIAAISPADTSYFESKYGKTIYLPAFHPNEKVTCKPGKNDFALYHGNLSIAENNEAALFLVKNVFSGSSFKLIISGNKPSKELQECVDVNKNVTLRVNDRPDQIHELVEQAHINILPTFQPTGIKLKLITALFRGRFCIVNRPMVSETGLESLCLVCESPQMMREELQNCFNKEFTVDEIEKRKIILEESFSNTVNANKLLQKIIF